MFLPYNSCGFQFELGTQSFQRKEPGLYAYRIVGACADSTWMLDAGRQLFLPSLPPGRYQLEIKFRGINDQWGPVSTFNVFVKPPWYSTWWAWCTGFVLLGLLAFAIYRYHINLSSAESLLRKEMHRLERAALQAQINPHFIFNCLNSIQHFILNNESDAAVLYLAKFAKLVRAALNASVAGQVSLEEEVKMLDNYLALEQLRFKGTFEYSIGIDEQLDLRETMLPPLIVQPYVENAVLHGIREKEKNGRIAITFRQADGYLVIHVYDNGSGLHQQRDGSDKTSLGGSITGRRLELMQLNNLYQAIGVEYLVPAIGTGTLVSIRLPL